MTTKLSRSAFLGAGIALGLALLILLAAGGGNAPEAIASVPGALQAPTPTLDPVTLDGQTAPGARSAQVQTPSPVTASKEKDNQ